MGSNTLVQIVNGAISDDDQLNQYFTALTGDFLPRNGSSGAPETNQHSLGSAVVTWKNIHVSNLFLNGTLFDPEAAGIDAKNAIVSGKTRTGSGQPDFIRASGSGASCTIQATATPLQITANNISVTISADIAVTSLTTAPGSNNTCLINDATLTDGPETRYVGEHPDKPIIVDNVGSEITNRVGEYICLKAGTEYMLPFVESTTVLRNVYRGFFFDSSGNPIVRETLAENDTLTIMSLGWVFMDSNGATVDVSYKSPIWSYDEPASPDTDDYWFDLEVREWKRYSGSAWVTQNRLPIGLVVIDGANCVASRSFDFTKLYSEQINLEVEVESVTVIRTKDTRSNVSVYGTQNDFAYNSLKWDIATDLESGLTEANTTLYHLYVTQDGEPVIATELPYNRRHDLGGLYHPYHSWRYVGSAYNDGSGNLIAANSKNTNAPKMQTFEASGHFIYIPHTVDYDVVCVGGGGGGARMATTTFACGGQAGASVRGKMKKYFGGYIAVTVGTAGSGRTGSHGDGSGGNSSVFDTINAEGGSPGRHDIATGGGTFDGIKNVQTGGKGSGGIISRGAYGDYGAVNNNYDGGVGCGGVGGGSGTSTLIGQGGRSTVGANGLAGFRGQVEVIY